MINKTYLLILKVTCRHHMSTISYYSSKITVMIISKHSWTQLAISQ